MSNNQERKDTEPEVPSPKTTGEAKITSWNPLIPPTMEESIGQKRNDYNEKSAGITRPDQRLAKAQLTQTDKQSNFGCPPEQTESFKNWSELFSVFSQTKEHAEDVSFMRPISAALYRRPNRLASIMLYTISCFFIIALLWMNWAEIDEITKGEGQVIPSSNIQMISHLEGGIIRKILVREGEEVKAGQVLLQIDDTTSEVGYRESVRQYNLSRLQVERLKAQIGNHEFTVPKEIDKHFPEMARKERERYQTALNREKNETQIAEQELEQKRQELRELNARKIQLKEQKEIDEEELGLIEPLVKSGAASKMELLNIRRRLSEASGELAVITESITRTEFAIKQATSQLEQVKISLRNEDLKELREATRQLSEASDAISKGKDRLMRTNIRSPVHGKVNELYIHTVGGVIQPGQELLSIVPIEDTLLIEARVSPSDIAFLRPGMDAIVKITAFDYSIYGGIEGKLVGISAGALKDEENNTYFRVTVKTNRNYIINRRTNEKLVISSGMVASIDILTGKRTILEYVMKPIKKGINNALTER